MATEPEVTDEQALEALQQLATPEGEESVYSTADDATDTELPTIEVGASSSEVDAEVTEEVEGEVAEDDLESLRSRNEELQTAAEKNAERLQAIQERHQASEGILRNRFLQKSTATEKALRILEQAQTESGVSEEEVKRAISEIKGTMNAASPSYEAPAQPQQSASEEQELVMNSFLSEKAMTREEADTFGNWVRTEGQTALSQNEQDVVKTSLDGFLRIAHNRWQSGMQDSDKETKRNDAVEAVKSVKRTQRQASRAASGSKAPAKQPAGSKAAEIDYDKLTETDISDLVKQSVEQYR